MKLLEIGTDPHSLDACAELMRAAFPQAPYLNARYLKWLYVDNPAGSVVGYNAWENGKIVGHYACIPVEVWLDGSPDIALLALNTAMHPDFRSAGLVFSLANKTCKQAAQRGFACVYAVANAASTPIFVQALKFQLVTPLTAIVGLGRLRPNWQQALAGNRFRRCWHSAAALWRTQNPGNPMALLAHDTGSVITRAKTHIPGVFAHGVMPVESALPDCRNAGGFGVNVFLGLWPEGSCRYFGYLPIPERLKPSPLNFIYKPLGEHAPRQLARNDIILGFHDFDPY